MRDLVLAKQFESATIVFTTQNLPGNINDKIEQSGYKIELLESNSIDELAELIKRYDANMIVIDHYDIDAYYEKELKKRTGIKIFVLDDTYEHHNCDILLNHNISANSSRYEGLLPASCEIRCGGEYTLLREEFYEAKKKKRHKANGHDNRNILVIMGGADHARKNIEIINVLEGFRKLKIHVVTTSANKYLEELKSFVKVHKNLRLHINTKQMAQLMADADLAIVTPSVTVNEVLFMGTPFIAIKTADNQKEIYDYLQTKSYNVLEFFDAKKLKILLEGLLS